MSVNSADGAGTHESRCSLTQNREEAVADDGHDPPTADRDDSSGMTGGQADAGPGTATWLRHCIDEDLAMHGIARWRPRYRLMRGELYFQVLLRRAEFWCHPSRRGPVGKFMAAQLKLRLRRHSERLGLDVPRYVFGPGLSLAHSGLLVVSAKSRVGRRCRIHHGVTLGASAGGAPTIGDDVFIGPNAVLIGPIIVGDRAFIYPGAVCSVDVPADHSAAGVPARVRPHSFSPWRPDSS